MVTIEVIEAGRPRYLPSNVELPSDGRRLRFANQGVHLVFADPFPSSPAGTIGLVEGVPQVLAAYWARIVLKGEDPRGVSSEYLVDGDEFAIGTATLRLHSDRSVECPACRGPLRARPLQGFGFPIDRCAGCLTLSRNRPEDPGAILVEGAFVRRVLTRIERAMEDGTLDDALREIRGDPELRPILQLPEIARLARLRE